VEFALAEIEQAVASRFEQQVAKHASRLAVQSDALLAHHLLWRRHAQFALRRSNRAQTTKKNISSRWKLVNCWCSAAN
jgi:hypothetical protein